MTTTEVLELTAALAAGSSIAGLFGYVGVRAGQAIARFLDV